MPGAHRPAAQAGGRLARACRGLPGDALAQDGLSALLQWASSRIAELKAEAERLGVRLRESREEAEKAQQGRGPGPLPRQRPSSRGMPAPAQDAQAEYDRFDARAGEAKRQKEIWRAAVPLARVWEAARASRLRDLLQAKLKEFAPDLRETG